MNVQIEFDDVVKGGTVNKTISVDTINRMQKTYQERKEISKRLICTLKHLLISLVRLL